MSIRVGVTGASGRMGGEVVAAASDREDVAVGLAVSRTPEAIQANRLPVATVEPAGEFDSLLGTRGLDAVIDFTTSETAVTYAEACAEADVAFVTGTTGFDDDHHTRLEATAKTIPVLDAPNFAPGVQTLFDLVETAVRRLPEYDVEVLEIHHREKRDAPSGTAARVLERIEAAGDVTERTHGRVGEAVRTDEEVGVHSLRAGGVRGEHEVFLGGEFEHLRIGHSVTDRGVFAQGALDAAVWLAENEPGRYSFAEVLGA